MKEGRILIRFLRSPESRERSLLIQAVAVLLGLAAMAGCATTSGLLPKDLPGEYVTLTSPIILVGDSQEHESTGFPLHQNDGAVDAYVEAAQRPPEQPLFGRKVLGWVIKNHPGVPLLHLGDLLDMSCLSEIRRMGQGLRQGETTQRHRARKPRWFALRNLQPRPRLGLSQRWCA